MNTKLTLLAGLFGAMAAIGCGGGSALQAPHSADTAGSPGSAASPPQAYGSQSAEGAAPSEPSPAAESPDSDRAEAESRPGLGTEWGENRESRVSSAPFFRQDSSNPFAVSKLFYNDRAGVQAMARREGVGSFSDGASGVRGGALTVRLLDSNGRPLEGINTGGTSHIIGEHGQRYIIQIKNNTGGRFEAVATVDGLDVISGRKGSFANRGYIVAPFATLEIDGFRRSFETVAAFRFGAVRNSYAAQKGDDRNVGVIGVAFFQERGSSFPWTQEEVNRRRNADPFPGQFAEPPATAF